MRRPVIKRARRNIKNLFPPSMRDRVWDHIRSKDAWALRHGQTLLTVTLNFCLTVAVLWASYSLVSSILEPQSFASADDVPMPRRNLPDHVLP
jgi:hypothetical protein